jgi:integrase
MAGKRRPNGQGTLFQRVPGGPWVAAWFDHTGKRRIKSTRTTDKRTAERLLAKYVADTALRRDGVVDPRFDRFSEANRVELAKQVDAYLTHCRQSGQAEKHLQEKKRHLKNLLAGTEATRLSELTGEALTKHMWAMKMAGKAARTVNFTRQAAVAFMGWCVNSSRIEVNPLKVVARQDERNDRRRVRRPLTNDEVAALLAVAGPRGRRAWYMAAALAGLRKGDLQRLRWADVDFDEGTITISDGKARREDIIPMHPQLAEELARRLREYPALPQTKVFPTTVTDESRLKDFLRAGLARREVVVGADGEPIMHGKGSRQRPKTRIVTEDAEGRVVDLHAMRTTLGTNLARAGVAPQLAQRIMRHSDYRTTLKHYTVLGLVDTAKAIRALPSIHETEPQATAATGTYGKRS